MDAIAALRWVLDTTTAGVVVVGADAIEMAWERGLYRTTWLEACKMGCHNSSWAVSSDTVDRVERDLGKYGAVGG